MNAIVLLSGGLDSATVLAMAAAEGRYVYALTFDYGQRHKFEIEAARKLAELPAVREHLVMELDLRQLGGSALTTDEAVPKDSLGESGIPSTYVPARNTIFLALAVAHAEVRMAAEIWIGINALDYSGYPDCRPEFVDAFQQVILKGTRDGVERGRPKILAPLLHMTKQDIIRRGIDLGLDYSLTHSCYDPDSTGAACGRCDACLLRRRGFAAAGVPDPTRYID